jgi:hypothetical protein
VLGAGPSWSRAPAGAASTGRCPARCRSRTRPRHRHGERRVVPLPRPLAASTTMAMAAPSAMLRSGRSTPRRAGRFRGETRPRVRPAQRSRMPHAWCTASSRPPRNIALAPAGRTGRGRRSGSSTRTTRPTGAFKVRGGIVYFDR